MKNKANETPKYALFDIWDVQGDCANPPKKPKKRLHQNYVDVEVYRATYINWSQLLFEVLVASLLDPSQDNNHYKIQKNSHCQHRIFVSITIIL